jgi:peptidoglycan/xylan/chitin deacetylase (PgdA/CDA1 family)
MLSPCIARRLSDISIGRLHTSGNECSSKDTGFCILMYHMIRPSATREEERFACSPKRFAAHMKFIQTRGFNMLGLGDILRYLGTNRPLPPRTVVITLDDGFRDNYEHAFSILQRYNVPATIFLASSFIDRTNTWMEDCGYPRREMLTWYQVRDMAANGIEFGGHTVSHSRLNELSENETRREIEDGKKQIEDQLGYPIQCFAYPYGLYNDRTPVIVHEAGYSLACSIHSGFNNPARDLYLLKRIEIYGTDPVWKLAQKLAFGVNNARLSMQLKYFRTRFSGGT